MGQGAVYGMVLMSVIALFSVVSADIDIPSCDGNMTVVEGHSLYFYCDGSDVPTSTYHWTLVTESGSTVPLATCYGRFNCSLTSVAETTFPGIVADQYSNIYTELWVSSTPQEFSGQLTCSQTFDNDTAQSASCAVRVFRIQTSGSCDIQEDTSGSCGCSTSRFSPSTVTWSLTTDTGLTLHLATCDTVSSCSSPQHENITVTRYSGYSYVSFTSIHRDKSGQLSCSFTYQGVTEMDSTQLTVYHPATLDNCSVGIVPHNWSLLLSCDVSHMFSSQGQYQFRIFEYFQFIKGQVTRNAGGYVFAGLKSFGDALTAYINNSNSREYYNGRLVHSWPLSPVPGRYTSFTVYVYTASSTSTSQRTYTVVTVGPPAGLTLHNCSDVSCDRDTYLAPCVCSTSYLGTPAGRLLWLLGETVLATGDYGANHLELPHNAVSTTKGWVMATCQLDWVTPLTASVVVETQCPKETSTDQHSPAMWIAVGAGAMLVVVIVVVVVVVLMCRRGHLSACRCGDPAYHSPKPNPGDSGHDPDHHVYDIVADSPGHHRAARSSDLAHKNRAMETDEHHM